MIKFLRKTFCFVLFSVIFLCVSGNYTFGLIRFLKEKSKLHQVMFIIDDQFHANAESNADAQLIGDVSKHFPSLRVSIHQAQANLETYFSQHLQIPRRTTLFIVMVNDFAKDTGSHLNAIFTRLMLASKKNALPKCLIHFSKQGKVYSYETMLKSLWHKDFVDISVLENSLSNETWQTKSAITIHRINLFADKYANQKVKPRTKWFPNKLLDIHGKTIKLMFMNGLIVKSKSYYIEVGRFRRYIEQSMHCVVAVDFSTESTIGPSFLKKAGLEMSINAGYFVFRNGPVLENPMRIISFSAAKAVIPHVRSKSKSVEVSDELIYMIAATTVAIAGIRIAALLLRFDRSTWDTFNISQIVMGMSVVNEPRKLAERIVFAAFMLSCMVYSGYVFSVILDISFREAPQMSTLEELANSSLTPMIDSSLNDSMLQSPLAYVRKLASKSVKIPGDGLSQQCLMYLFKNRNVSCIMLEAEAIVDTFKNLTEAFSFKILEEAVVYCPTSWIVRKGSPFIDRFNEIILKAFDRGFLQRMLFGSNLRRMQQVSSPEIIEKEKLLLVLFYLLTIGYTLAAVALLAEILSNFLCSKAKQ